MTIILIIWFVFSGFIIYNTNKNLKKAKKKFKAIQPTAPNVKVGEIYNTGERKIYFYGKNKNEFISVTNEIIIVLKINAITMGELLAAQGSKVAWPSKPNDSMCHIVFYNDRMYYVPYFYWYGYIQKIETV